MKRLHSNIIPATDHIDSRYFLDHHSPDRRTKKQKLKWKHAIIPLEDGSIDDCDHHISYEQEEKSPRNDLSSEIILGEVSPDMTSKLQKRDQNMVQLDKFGIPILVHQEEEDHVNNSSFCCRSIKSRVTTLPVLSTNEDEQNIYHTNSFQNIVLRSSRPKGQIRMERRLSAIGNHMIHGISSSYIRSKCVSLDSLASEKSQTSSSLSCIPEHNDNEAIEEDKGVSMTGEKNSTCNCMEIDCLSIALDEVVKVQE